MAQRHFSNQAVIDYLNYYVTVDHKFDYAVLLDGPWGSGKTHLIKEFLQKRTQTGAKSLYISLYGITSVSQIEDEFYRILHPILSSKGMRIASILTRSAAKGLLKLDFDGKFAGLETEIAIPEIKLSDYLKGPADQLLIFDDLERCAIDVKDILGYINSFVEHDGMKVIILANEQEIKRRSTEYVLMKEKLIGQTLKIWSDIDSAYPDFLTTISDLRVKDFLSQERYRVLEIHTQSGTNNLRVLQQSLWDFERLSRLFSDEKWTNIEGMQKLLELTLALSMEIRTGKISSNELDNLTESYLVRYVRKNKSEESTSLAEKFEQKYTGIPLGDAVFRPDILGRIIIEGLSDVELIENALSESRYFTSLADIPAWRRAWYAFESEDEVYEAAVSNVASQFAARSELEPTILYHMFGVLLRASKIGVLEMSTTDILNDGKAYVDEIFREERIFTTRDRPCDLTTLHANSDGLGFSEADTPEFKEFTDYYIQAATIATKKSYALWARTLASQAEVDPTEFMFDLCLNKTRSSPYHDVPILASLPPEEFVAMVIKLPARGQITIFATLKSRYEYNKLELALADEKPWLGRVRELLIEAVKAVRPLTRYRILQMIKGDLDPILVQAGLLTNSESEALAY